MGGERTAQYPTAPMVATGDPITSTEYRRLVDAFRARARLGVGDPNWRAAVYSMSLVRQVRNPDSTGFLWPSQFEWHDFYAHVNEDHAVWPTSGPGEPEGANLANPLMAYIFGSEYLNLYDEATRLTDPFYGGLDIELPGGPQPEAWRKWELRKRQCGGWDPTSGALSSPAFTVARAYGVIRHDRFSPHGNAYGGFVPGPDTLGTACAELSPGGIIPPNLEVKFTALVASPVYSGAGTLSDGYSDCGLTLPCKILTYPGTCRQTVRCLDADDDRLDPTHPDYDPTFDQSECYEGHVAGIVYSPWSYYVILNGGSFGVYTVEQLSTSEWQEGPYCGEPQLMRTFGNTLERVFWEFIRGWRGSEESQIPATGRGAPPSGDPLVGWLESAFDIQRFMTEQYALAPAIGSLSGTDILVLYPRYDLGTGNHPSGTALSRPEGDLAVGTDCVVHGANILGVGVQGQAQVEVYDKTSDRRLALLTCSQGESSQTVWFASPTTVAGCLALIGVRTVGRVQVGSGGSISVELAHSMDYKPGIWDLMMVVRIMGARR